MGIRLLRLALSLPKSIFFCFYLFPLKIAIKLPVLVDYRTKFLELHRNTIKLEGKIKFGIIKIGWGNGSNGIECNRFSYWCIKKNCLVIFNGSAHFSRGVTLRADNGGQILFGDGITANQNFFCASNTSISFGENVVLGWNIHVRDSDGHNILNQNNKIINNNRFIKIGNHVWLASYSNILKGVVISDNSIVAFGSIVTKIFTEPNIIIGGIPAVVVKRNINWNK